jgi:hypothetical protein
MRKTWEIGQTINSQSIRVERFENGAIMLVQDTGLGFQPDRVYLDEAQLTALRLALTIGG